MAGEAGVDGRSTKGVVGIHNKEDLDIDLSRLATLECFLEFVHDRLVKAVFGIGVGVLDPDTRLVEEIQLEAPIYGATCEECFPRVGKCPGKCVVHGSCGGRDADLVVGDGCVRIEEFVEMLGQSTGEVMAAGGAAAIKKVCIADFVLVFSNGDELPPILIWITRLAAHLVPGKFYQL